MISIRLPKEYERYVEHLPDSIITQMLIDAINARLHPMKAETAPVVASFNTDELIERLQGVLAKADVKVTTEAANKPLPKENKKLDIQVGEKVAIEAPDTGDDLVDDFLLDIFK